MKPGAVQVKSVHPPWAAIPEKVLIQIGEHLRRYSNVYSTNYDLLMYWARMSVNEGKPSTTGWVVTSNLDAGIQRWRPAAASSID
jgi:hypothetical protein